MMLPDGGEASAPKLRQIDEVLGDEALQVPVEEALIL
jgi:hypothetical protein